MKYVFFFVLGGVLVGLILGFAAGRLWYAGGPGSPAVTSEANEDENKPASKVHSGPVVRLSPEQIRDFGIEIGQAGPAKLAVRKVLPGEIVMDPDRVTHVSPRVSGIVVRIDKNLGDPVDEGEVMAVIDSSELGDAKAGYLAAVERNTLAQASFDREKILWEKKISSEKDYLNARQALSEASINLRNARQNMYSLGFDEEYLKKLPDLPDVSYTRYEIVAPFRGTVIAKQIGLGETVTEASQIYRIADLSTVWAELTVYQKNLGSICKGLHVTIGADDVDAKVTGVIEYISPVIEESTRTATARVVISNPKGIWRPGTFVTAQVEAGSEDVPLAVARGAVTKLEGRNVVFIQTDEGFEPRPVNTGRSDQTSIEILEGLEPGQRYVRTNAFTVKAELSKETFAGGDND